MNLPKHINLTIEHQPQGTSYQTAEQYILDHEDQYPDHDEYTANERAAMIATNEIWMVQWYPNTPVGSHSVWASTLECALAAAHASLTPEAPRPKMYTGTFEAMQWIDTDANREAFYEWFDEHGVLFETRGSVIVWENDVVEEGEWVISMPDDFVAISDEEFRKLYKEVP